MATIESVITPIFIKFSEKFGHSGTRLDLDLRYPNMAVGHPEKISVPLTFYLSFVEKENLKTNITISSSSKSVVIKDSETFLSPDELKKFNGKPAGSPNSTESTEPSNSTGPTSSAAGVHATSRLGFGTKIEIPL